MSAFADDVESETLCRAFGRVRSGRLPASVALVYCNIGCMER